MWRDSNRGLLLLLLLMLMLISHWLVAIILPNEEGQGVVQVSTDG